MIDDTTAVLAFLREAGRLKDTERTAWTPGGRRESTAEHSWRLALLAMALQEQAPELDGAKILKMCLVHDLGEAYEGDISAKANPDPDAKEEAEERAMARLLSPLPDGVRRELYSLWREYNEGVTAEARWVKALDKMETIVTHNQGRNPRDFDYRFNLAYGREHASAHPVLARLREAVDEETRERLQRQEDSRSR
ncbi:HD domain-containing protein [Paenibacillus sp. CC-CFT747]|nr:HD domain-containing protein [Paenibacillus sp. CC-CFT747]